MVVVNYWLELADVRPRLDRAANRLALQLGWRRAGRPLAVQRLFYCSRTDGLAECTTCGTPFLPGPQRPRRDRNVMLGLWMKAAARDAAARYRQTEKYLLRTTPGSKSGQAFQRSLASFLRS